MKRYIELGPEGSREQELLFLWNWGAPPSCHPDELTNPEGLCLLVNVLFYLQRVIVTLGFGSSSNSPLSRVLFKKLNVLG